MLVHLYYGEGKGKSTAAAGLALRALAAGYKVYFLRFMKGGGPLSGEIRLLEQNGAVIVDGKTSSQFASKMSKEEQSETRIRQDSMLAGFLGDEIKDRKEKVSLSDREAPELLVLDEALAAVNYGLLDEELLKGVVKDRPKNREIVLTGRGPSEWMLEEADYITQFCCIRHPYDKGIEARRGIEL